MQRLRGFMRPTDPSLTCEFVARWLGGTTVAEIGLLLGYKHRRVTALLESGFAQRTHATARYDSRSKRWISTVRAEELHGPRTVTEATVALQALRLWARGSETESLFPIVDTRSFRQPVSADIFCILQGACARHQVVDVIYRTKKREFTAAFSPHMLVNTSHRLHFRGYSYFEEIGRGHYWDLLPTRVLQAEIRAKPNRQRMRDDDHWRYVDGAGDIEWHTKTPLNLELRDELPEDVRQAVRHEHRMNGDRLELGLISMALHRYVRAEYTTRTYTGFPQHIWSDPAP